MHCPKCGNKYPDGSQRFCDADGERLLSLSHEASRGGRQTVFAGILSTPEAVHAEVLPIEFVIDDEDEKITDELMSELFFETEDDDNLFWSNNEPENGVRDEDEKAAEVSHGSVSESSIGLTALPRKIDPAQIPAGHIEVDNDGDREHPSIRSLDFDPESPNDLVGRIVKGRYRVTELLREDDTGFAYVAEDGLANDRRVVVRILANEELDEMTESILAEERISLSHINHPNVLRLIDSGQFANGINYLISEHSDALTAIDILDIHGPLSALRVAKLIRQAAEALSEVHHEGILHRDIRPEAILVTLAENDTELVKIADFGVSSGKPNSDNIYYRAPETLDGRIPTVAGDVYSLGVVAYQLLTGKLPFSGDTERAFLKAQRAGLETFPTDLRHDLSTDVDEVIERALSRDPLGRYPTARDLGEDLFAALTAAPDPMIDEAHVTVLDEQNGPVKEGSIVPGSQRITIPANVSAERSADVDELAWTRRSPEPPAKPDPNWTRIAIVGSLCILLTAIGIWYYVLVRPTEPEFRVPTDQEAANPANAPSQLPLTPEQRAEDIEVPPLSRTIAQPPNTDFFQSSKQGLKGDLVRNFVGFSLYYPQNWKATGPKESADGKTRGKFLDIANTTPEGRLKEQMLVSYYASNGTFKEDTAKFPQLVKETNETLKKLIPNFQMVSEGNTIVNGGWNAYEVKFQGSGTGDNGERLLVWGRRLFVPAARPGVRSGFEITMLATSYADDVRSVDDVGVRGDLGAILYTFEPGQNF